MGAWGTGIFSDDTAADVRDDWREAITDGLEPALATKKLVAAYRDVLDDEDEAAVFWLALAAVQARTGRLQDEVRDRALAIIDVGGDAQRWREEDEKLGRQRAKVLAELAAKLRGPQRPPTKLRRPAITNSELHCGDVVLINGEHGNTRALFLVVGVGEGWPPGSRCPIVVPLLWEDRTELPTADEAARLPLVVEVEMDDRVFRNVPPAAKATKVYAASRGKTHLSNFGKVVVHGVEHVDAPDQGDTDNACNWSFLADWIEGPWYRACVAETRRLHGLA